MLETYLTQQQAGNAYAPAGAAGSAGAAEQQHPQQQKDRMPHVGLLASGGVQADAAQSLAMRPAENVPVYVMLPLDTVSESEGGEQKHDAQRQQQQSVSGSEDRTAMPAETAAAELASLVTMH